MSRVLTFSTQFPSYHPKAGEPTFFVEKIYLQQGFLHLKPFRTQIEEIIGNLNDAGSNETLLDEFITSIEVSLSKVETPLDFGFKNHTIRAGHRFKPGDKFSPRVWSGKPYNSKQITIAPDIEVVSTWDFDIDMLGGEYRLNGFEIPINTLREISTNDGFSDLDDFELWFNTKKGKYFLGQIICWNKSIDYKY